MPNRPALCLALASAALALSGCTKDATSYPSLSIRNAERVSGSFQPAPAATPYVPPKPGAETLGAIGKLRADAEAAHTRFLAAAQKIGSVPGRNAEVGSDAWSDAQVALADLTSARSETMIPLAELDRLFAAAQNDGEDTAEIEAARSEVDVWVAAEDKVIDSF